VICMVRIYFIEWIGIKKRRDELMAWRKLLAKEWIWFLAAIVGAYLLATVMALGYDLITNLYKTPKTFKRQIEEAENKRISLIIKDPDFWRIPIEAQRNIFKKLYSSFGSLSRAEQNKHLISMRPHKSPFPVKDGTKTLSS